MNWDAVAGCEREKLWCGCRIRMRHKVRTENGNSSYGAEKDEVVIDTIHFGLVEKLKWGLFGIGLAYTVGDGRMILYKKEKVKERKEMNYGVEWCNEYYGTTVYMVQWGRCVEENGREEELF